MADGPSPEQQADYLVRKLEQTIRDNRTVKGMSFRTWQAIAREEIVNTLRAAERRHTQHDRTVNRVMLIGAASLVSIGFWGAVVAVDRTFGGWAALVSVLAGACLFFIAADWGIKRASAGWSKRKRQERLANIEDLDRRIKRMEEALRKKEGRLKEKMEEVGLL
ncbi:hypothetical protein [Magnetospirillum gryphiswaldense]|uniref:Uncharacterized protein n=2 Tax=Magnetospirillum gryphiswaldense TaxID=55518 RepID=V6F1M1_MAGGM|nr:hypothetical protein [Magnetospirillum gryphiswaldense]AVM72707.1 hypothetical protein MSR1_01860 [Magnetospirillum gryphiswaldense MSR-1]AVM76610.1 hypothetical protein MSR1L_01860 [Magnetospirillum gryphiswaldense]CDK99267.1 protein of unknown function [Magnetospirillum gryphiswaldense MSR-1 v2]